MVKMIVIGIDPGIATVGYGIIEMSGAHPQVHHLDHGALVTSKSMRQQERLLRIYDEISALIAEHDPYCVAMEKLYFSKNVTSALQVAEARGVILLATADRGVPVEEYTPQQVKMAVTGWGRANKRQIQWAVRRLLDLDRIPQPDDAADALAVAICHANWWQVKEKQMKSKGMNE